MSAADYPKAKYKQVQRGEGDQIGNFNTGRHSYITAIAETAEDEAAMGPEWLDRPEMTDVNTTDVTSNGPMMMAEVKRGPGRPRLVKDEKLGS